MNGVAEVRLWGTRIGAVSLSDGAVAAEFQFDPSFSASGIQVAPLTMPLGRVAYSFPALDPDTYRGLPGLLIDSLPDHYGNAVIDTWLAAQGRPAGSMSSIERLCYVGSRGMGALEFAPPDGPQVDSQTVLDVAELRELASEVLAHRAELVASLAEGRRKADAMRAILSVGTSAGGARAKALIAWNRETGEVRSGQVDAAPGFEQWLLKFDGVENNRDLDKLEAPQGYGAIEYTYALMARDAGIDVSECRLMPENGRRHFMTRRFDRTSRGKVHMQSLCGIAHFDYRRPGAYSYEQAIGVLREIGVSQLDVEQLFRRMVFNIVARNQDDHTKNIACLMDRSGSWRLAPAFDVTFSYRPDSEWVNRHQMSVNLKRDDFTIADLEAVGKVALLPRGRAATIYREIAEVVSEWPRYAEHVGVDERQVERIAPLLRLRLPAGR